MASSCPPTGPGHVVCTFVQWPDIGPSSGSAGQAVSNAVGGVADSALHGLADAAASAANGLLKTLSSMWMTVNTPNLSAATDLQTWTKWITTAVAVVCILVAAGQMALRRRGEPAQAMLAGLARVVITGAAATFLVQAAGSLADQYSSDMMNSTVAHLNGGGWSGVISTTLIASAISPGDLMLLIVALLIIISSLIQLMLMIMRIGLLVALTGTLPLAAAASMSDWGQTWWRKHIGWLAAWLLYKPTAALLYLAAFRLTQGKALTEVLSGFMLLILAVLILPALLRVIVPATANLGAGSGGHLAMAAGGALATGAVRAGLHRPGGLATALKKKDASSPGNDGGPSGAEVTAGGNPPSSSSAERREQSPPSSVGSAETGTTIAGGTNDDSGPDSRPGRSRRARAAAATAATAATLAAGLSANDASWRSRDVQHADDRAAGAPMTGPSSDGNPARRADQTKRGPAPSGAVDKGDDAPRENGS